MQIYNLQIDNLYKRHNSAVWLSCYKNILHAFIQCYSAALYRWIILSSLAKFASESLEIMLLCKSKVLNIWYRLRVVPIFPHFSLSPQRLAFFTRARISLALLSLMKNGDYS